MTQRRCALKVSGPESAQDVPPSGPSAGFLLWARPSLLGSHMRQPPRKTAESSMGSVKLVKDGGLIVGSSMGTIGICRALL